MIMKWIPFWGIPEYVFGHYISEYIWRAEWLKFGVWPERPMIMRVPGMAWA
jgi:hypothetical protein